jgi:hypothetical protein
MRVAVVGDNNTLIKVSFIGRDEFGEQVLSTSTMTRTSIGTWFYSFGDKDKAILFNPEAESDFLAGKSEDLENLQESNESTLNHHERLQTTY